MLRLLCSCSLVLLLLQVNVFASSSPTRIKELVHIKGARSFPLTGYGIVMGLAGTGDSSRNAATINSVANALKKHGIRVSETDLLARNVAAVMVTATMPPFAEEGDPIDVTVSSIGDARSLVGGTLLLTPLSDPLKEIGALAQGAVSVGGFNHSRFSQEIRKNHPTVGRVPGGATVETPARNRLVSDAGRLVLILDQPDFITAGRIATALNQALPPLSDKARVRAIDAGHISVLTNEQERMDLVRIISAIENTRVSPDRAAVVVVNERTGTIVSGGDVRLASTSITHGDLNVSISTDFLVSQPGFIGNAANSGVVTAIVPNANLSVTEEHNPSVQMNDGATVHQMVQALNEIKVSPRDIIVILQSLKKAGALHAKLIVQ